MATGKRYYWIKLKDSFMNAPEDKKEAPGTTYRSHGPVPLGREPYPKIERVDE